MVLSGCRMFSVVFYGFHGFCGSRRFLVVLVDSQLFFVVLPVCSRSFSIVLSGSRSVSVVLCCSH